MSEMEEVLKEERKVMDEFGKLTPKRMKGFGDLLEVIKKNEAIAAKNRELINVALSIANHCKWCIAFHVKSALEEGASKDEILQAAWLSILMGGAPSLMYSQYVVKAINEFG